MRKVELLAPAGSFEALKAAVISGADAVYLGGIRFGARAYASNFDEQSLIEAVKYCHLRHVKVYVTVNTLVYEHELNELKQYLRFLYNAHVDAVIVQDFGVFQILKNEFPDFEVHCSTQMHIHNKAGVQFMKKMGAGRVVLARETPIELIRECTKEGIDIEVFVHGALCMCYSGQCLFSSFNGGRSGNRGECAQPCRKAYQLINLDTHEIIKTPGDYLLSPKDLWTLDHVEELIDAGVLSFKIEGRMKRPEYVAEVVRVYRKAIDSVLNQKKPQVDENDQMSLMKLFNRKTTAGHLFHEKGYNLLNPLRPNHMGIPLGKVVKTAKGKITIELSHDLHQNDGIRILSAKGDMGLLAGRIVLHGRLVNAAKANDIIEIETSLPITCRKYDQVVLTTDRLQCESITARLQHERQFPVDMIFHAVIGEKAQLIINDGNHRVSVSSEETVQQALKQPVTEEKIYAQLSKLNETIYYLNRFEKTGDDNLFISLKTINEMRRNAIQLLNERRLEFTRTQMNYPDSSMKNIQRLPEVIYDISNESQLSVFEDDTMISSKLKHDQVSVKGLRVDEHSQVLSGSLVMHTQISTLNASKENQIWVCDASLNVTNSYAIEFLMEQGADGIVASLEANDEAISQMISGFEQRHGFTPQVGKMMYGKRELMIMKGCLVNAALGNGQKTKCSLCRCNRYALVNEKGDVFPLSQDGFCHPIVYDSQTLKETEFSDKISFRILRFTDESAKECKEIKKYYENIF